MASFRLYVEKRGGGGGGRAGRSRGGAGGPEGRDGSSVLLLALTPDNAVRHRGPLMGTDRSNKRESFSSGRTRPAHGHGRAQRRTRAFFHPEAVLTRVESQVPLCVSPDLPHAPPHASRRYA
jgi:hypothetical protein